MVYDVPSSTRGRSEGGFVSRAARFKWAACSAIVTFAAVYWIDVWMVHHGLRRDATLLDDFLLSSLVLGLGIAQQLRHERQLERQRQLVGVIADMNHYTRNALQVIVSRSALSIADSAAVEDIQRAVQRIDWCLREILPDAEGPKARKASTSPSLPEDRVVRSHTSASGLNTRTR